MKWVTDRTGRFVKRPHYDPTELDQECERIICKFLLQKHKKVEFPITTSDLTIASFQKRIELGICSAMR